MCGSAADDPSMHDVEEDVDDIPPVHDHFNPERFVAGCPKCEADAIEAERSFMRRNETY